MSTFDVMHDRSRADSADSEVSGAEEAPIRQVRPVAGLIAGENSSLRRAAQVDPLGGTQVPDDVEARLAGSRGGGSPLPERLAGSLGEAMGADLSGVRVHANSQADALSRSVQAVAFTQGSDVYFSSGAYSPSTSQGQHLIAHEIAHVVQASAGGSGGAGAALSRSLIGRADDPAEAAADRVADHTMAALRRTPT
jgi:hypothetical protein